MNSIDLASRDGLYHRPPATQREAMSPEIWRKPELPADTPAGMAALKAAVRKCISCVIVLL